MVKTLFLTFYLPLPFRKPEGHFIKKIRFKLILNICTALDKTVIRCYIMYMENKKILLLNGPNLQLLGVREPEIYGSTTLPEIVAEIRSQAAAAGYELVDFQSNSEGELVSCIASAYTGRFAGIIFNPAAYTHTSVALRDALAAVRIPTVEVHLSNISSREEFRKTSLTAEKCIGVVAGFGPDSYELALRGLLKHLSAK